MPGPVKASAAPQDALPQSGMRLTRQRRILLDLIDKTGEHLDAESLFHMAREKDPKLNRVTVYRTLKLLKEGGLVDELDLMHQAGEQHFYETRRKQEHAHVICLSCGKVEEFFGEPLKRLRRQVETQFGFQIVLARTEIGGYCSHCQALRARELELAAVRVPVAARKKAPAARKKAPAARKKAPAARKKAPAARKKAPAARKKAPAAREKRLVAF